LPFFSPPPPLVAAAELDLNSAKGMTMTQGKETLLKGKDQYSLPPCPD
jgi:hypothetical protein